MARAPTIHDVSPRLLARVRSPHWPVVGQVALVVVAVALAACGGGKKASEQLPDLAGTYLLVGDVGGTQVKAGATVTLTLKSDGTLEMLAVQPGERVTSSGSWQVKGDKMTIDITDLGASAKDGAYKVEGQTLTIPVQIFGDGPGASLWRRSDSPASASGSPGATKTAPKTSWNLWDLDKDAAAAGTKVFYEAVQKGTSPTQAVQQAVDQVRRNSNVSDVQVSANGLNVMIRYKDGSLDYVLTERLAVSPTGRGSLQSMASELMAAVSPSDAGLASDAASASLIPACAALPGSPATGQRPEPGREGVNPAGGYGVTIYLPDAQPKPVKSSDSPASDARRALLVSPVYDLEHPMTNARYDSIRTIVGNGVECIEADLAKAGYTSDKVLGRLDSGKAVMSGDQALEEMTKLLTTKKYGVVYFLSHGTAISSWKPWIDDFSMIYFGLVNMDRPEIKKVVNNRKLTKEVKTEIGKELARVLGLSWNDENPPFVLGSEFDGSALLWLRPNYFQQLRDSKSVSFDSTLFFVNTCSSAANKSLPDAIKPKVYFGWQNPMDGDFISDAAETVFDSLTDKVRTARQASQLWQLHESWVVRGETSPRDANRDFKKLVALGQSSTPYDPINAQTWILIYRIRHGPASASSDVAKSMTVVQECFNQFWSAGRGAGLGGPSCRPMEYGSDQPTREDIDEAFFEVGSLLTKPFGRWTLAD